MGGWRGCSGPIARHAGQISGAGDAPALMLALSWSTPAERDLDRIEAWLDRIDAALADDAVGAILDRIELALSNPSIGSPLPGGRRKIAERRFGHVILYRHDRSTLTILRIRHEREDWR
jgi:plasmid stabilization system protein ParE